MQSVSPTTDIFVQDIFILVETVQNKRTAQAYFFNFHVLGK